MKQIFDWSVVFMWKWNPTWLVGFSKFQKREGRPPMPSPTCLLFSADCVFHLNSKRFLRGPLLSTPWFFFLFLWLLLPTFAFLFFCLVRTKIITRVYKWLQAVEGWERGEKQKIKLPSCRIELQTFSLQDWRSTTELWGPLLSDKNYDI